MNSKSEIRNQKSPVVSLGTAIKKTAAALAASSSTPRLDAEVLVMHACGSNRNELITRHETALTSEQQNKLDDLLARRQRGEPVAYLTGTREFWSMEFNVTPATLIPRPETELLAEKALEHIPRDAAWTIADLGTGSGAIALVIAKERPHSRVVAADNSPAALEVAASNARKFGLTNIEFRAGDWFAPLVGETFDMIVSNPPYIRAGDAHLNQGDLRFEPAAALVSGADGLDAIRHIALNARKFLKPGGWLLFEHGWDQSRSIKQILLQNSGPPVVFHADLSGHDRICEMKY